MQRGWKLKKNRPQLRFHRLDQVQKSVEFVIDIFQFLVVGDAAVGFEGKKKILGTLLHPVFCGLLSGQMVKGTIELHRRKVLNIVVEKTGLG